MNIVSSEEEEIDLLLNIYFASGGRRDEVAGDRTDEIIDIDRTSATRRE